MAAAALLRLVDGAAFADLWHLANGSWRGLSCWVQGALGLGGFGRLACHTRKVRGTLMTGVWRSSTEHIFAARRARSYRSLGPFPRCGASITEDAQAARGGQGGLRRSGLARYILDAGDTPNTPIAAVCSAGSRCVVAV